MGNKDAGLVQKALDWGYDVVIGDKNPLKNAKQLADEYLQKAKGDKLAAAKAFISNREKYCFTTGFILGLGGMITLPVSIPASLTALIYLQIQIAAVVAAIAGKDLHSDEVKTTVYTCMAGLNAKEIAKEFGIKLGNKLTYNAIKSISGQTLMQINKAVGFKLATKFGEKGLLNLGKAVPIAGGLISGLLDMFSAKTVGKISIDRFITE